jgi:hypothetical protein
MSNYPPGVTGNEYEIAGGKESEENFDCNATANYISITKHEMNDLSDYVLTMLNEYKRSGNLSEFWIANYMKPLLRKMYDYMSSFETYDSDCNYSGIVLKEGFQDTVSWECPKCGKDYQEKISWYYEE